MRSKRAARHEVGSVQLSDVRRESWGARDYLASQLGHPRGALAPIIGRILNLSNAGQNRLAVRALGIQQDHRVLDVGFGGGVGLRLLLDEIVWGQVAGVEISREMLERARDRHANEIASGRLVLQPGCVERLPFDDGSFDRVVSVNTYPFWTDPAAAFAEIRRVLHPGGRLALALVGPEILRMAGLRPGTQRLEQPGQTASRAASAGLDAVALQQHNDPKRTIVLTAARQS